jgi:hypothetical protein
MAYYKLNRDGTIQSRSKQVDDTWLPLSGLETKEDGSYYDYYNQDGTPDLAKEQKLVDAKALEEADKARTQAMLEGSDYNGTVVSLTKSDGDGLVQVKSGFELGLTDTVIHFENGAKLPMNVSDFPTFALWFVNERNKFFVGV